MGKPTEEVRDRKKASHSNIALSSTDHYNPELDDIPDIEKFRLVEASGLFPNLTPAQRKKLASSSKKSSSQDEEQQFGHGFQAILYTIPLCSVYCVMDMLVHRQFNENVTFWPFFNRVLKAAPIMLILVYYTNKYAAKPLVQFLMFLGAIGCGCYLIWIINKISYLGVMRRCPPLASLWIYFVVQMRLAPAVASLVTVFIYFYFGDPNFKI
ncbi:hypothetical protein G9A89_019365 [Geosiphon pyriformis]|nr:hypothetical protein G9A89_019365 [Geosiphon pyriformis]